MPAYPTTVATDATLIAADNRASTTLLGTISSGATTIVVNSGVFSAYSVVTIENERILLGSISVPGTYIGCTRGYDGSSAAAHTNGVAVRANVVAAHHNVLVDELIAVETALGANLQFVQKVFNADGFTFSFTGTTNLTGSSPATVVITPPPAGITAASINKHYIYITDGASSEAVLLTNVSVGASSTTVTFIPANSHTSGQWTIGSASGGIQEAIKYAESFANGGAVQVPRGSTTIRQKIFLAGTPAIEVYGSRQGSTLSPGAHNTFDCVEATQTYTLRDFSITYANGAPGIAPAINAVNATSGNVIIDNVQIRRAYIGINLNTILQPIIRNCKIWECQREGILATFATEGGFFNNVCYDNDQAGATKAAMKIDGGGKINILGNACYNSAGTTQDYGILLDGTLPYLTMVGNSCFANNTANYQNGSPATFWTISGNGGMDTNLGAITAAATVSLLGALSKVYVITGTTTINTINGAWGTGHEVIFICPNGLTFSAAGNIASAVTTTFANQVVRGVFNSTADKWYLYA